MDILLTKFYLHNILRQKHDFKIINTISCPCVHVFLIIYIPTFVLDQEILEQ